MSKEDIIGWAVVLGIFLAGAIVGFLIFEYSNLSACFLI